MLWRFKSKSGSRWVSAQTRAALWEQLPTTDFILLGKYFTYVIGFNLKRNGVNVYMKPMKNTLKPKLMHTVLYCALF